MIKLPLESTSSDCYPFTPENLFLGWSLGVSFGTCSRSCGGCSCGSSFFNSWLRNGCYDDSTVELHPNAFGQGEIADVQSVTNIEVGNIRGQFFRKVLGKATDFNIVKVKLKQSAKFGTSRFANELNRH
jgi:hypothetical protein